MHSVDRHKDSVAEANSRTFDRFGVYGPYKPGTEQHSFWLSVYDDRMVKIIVATGRENNHANFQN